MIQIKPGIRLYSTVCDTEIMVIKGMGEESLKCGGVVMATSASQRVSKFQDDQIQKSLIGKRYINNDGTLEVLCTRPGAGNLTVDNENLIIKQAQALPSSD